MHESGVKSIVTTVEYERVYSTWAQLTIGDACARLHRPPWEHPVAVLLADTSPHVFSSAALAIMLADLLLLDMKSQIKWLQDDIRHLKSAMRYVVVSGTPVVYRARP